MAIRENSVLWKLTRTWGHSSDEQVLHAVSEGRILEIHIPRSMLPGRLCSKRFSTATEYEIKSHAIEDIAVVPAKLNTRAYSVDLGVGSRDNSSEPGRLG